MEWRWVFKIATVKKEAVEWKTIHPLQERVNDFELYQCWKAMIDQRQAILRFWFDLPLVEMKFDRRGQENSVA